MPAFVSIVLVIVIESSAFDYEYDYEHEHEHEGKAMQRTESGGIIISCDFCGTDWDAYDESNPRPMVEGHHGSVFCLECVKLALEGMAPRENTFRCTMCIIEDIAADVPRWVHPAPVPSPGLNADAVACKPCIHQAAGRFSKDKDVDWKWVR